MKETPPTNPSPEVAAPAGPNRRRVRLLVAGAVLLVLGVGVFAGVRYGMYRLESRDMRNEGVALANEGEFEAAELLLQTYHMRQPSDMPAVLALARAKLSQRPVTSARAFEALALLDDYLVDQPEGRAAKLLRLQALLGIGQGETAFAYARELHSAMPSQPTPLAVLTRGLMQQGAYAEAVNIAERALNTPLPQPSLRDLAHDVLVQGHTAMGQRQTAAKWARESLDFDPLSPSRLERWASVAPPRTDPNQWVQYADEAESEPTMQGDVLRLVALQLAQRRSLEINHPEQARLYRGRFLSLLEQLSATPSLSAEHTSLIARQLEIEERFDDQGQFLRRLGRGDDATDEHRLMWAKHAFFTDQPGNFDEARELVAPENRPPWLEAYAALLARRQGDTSQADLIQTALASDASNAAGVYGKMLDHQASPLQRLRGLAGAWTRANDPVLLHQVAQDLSTVGHHEAAAAALIRAARAAPAWAQPHTDLASALLDLDRAVLASQTIENAFRHGAPTAVLDELRLRASDQRLEQLTTEQRDAHLALLGTAEQTDTVAQRLRAWWSAGVGRDADARALAERVVKNPSAWPRGDRDAHRFIETLELHAPGLIERLTAELPSTKDAPPALAFRLSEALAARGQSRRAWSAFDTARAHHTDGPAALDWAVARIALGASTGEPAAALWAQELLGRFGLEDTLAGVTRWPELLRHCKPLRDALRRHKSLDPATATALGLHIDQLQEQIFSAGDLDAAVQVGNELKRALAAYAGQSPADVLATLDRLFLATGRYGDALALRIERQRQRPDLASRSADVIVLLRLLANEDNADQLLARLELRADQAIAQNRAPDLDLVTALARLGDTQRVAQLFARSDLAQDSPDLKAARFFWQLQQKNDEAAWQLAQALWEGPRQNHRWQVLAQLPGLTGDSERLRVLAERLKTLPLDPADAQMLRLSLTERRGDQDATAAMFAEPFQDDLTHARLWQWHLTAQLIRDPDLDPASILAAAATHARSGAWFEQLNTPDDRAALRRAFNSPATTSATRAALGADRPAAPALRVLDRIADAHTADAATPDPALRSAVAGVHDLADVSLAFVQSPAADPAQTLDQLGLMIVRHRLPPSLGRQIISMCAQSGNLLRANHYGTLLAATHDAADNATLLTVASLRAAAGATNPATHLAARLSHKQHPGLDQPAYASELASIFLSAARFRDARQLLLARIHQDPAWRNAALRVLPQLTGHPAELTAWLEALAPTVGPTETSAWLHLARAAAACHEQTGNPRPVAAVRQRLEATLASRPSDAPAPAPLIASAGLLAQITGDFDAMQRHYNFLLTDNPDDPATLNNFADGLVSMNQRLDDALRMAQSADATLPDNPQISDTLARIHEAQGNADQAQTFAQRAAQLAPDNTQWAINLLALHLRQDNTAAARTVSNDLKDRLQPDADQPLSLTPPQRRQLERLTETLHRRQSARPQDAS